MHTWLIVLSLLSAAIATTISFQLPNSSSTNFDALLDILNGQSNDSFLLDPIDMDAPQIWTQILQNMTLRFDVYFVCDFKIMFLNVPTATHNQSVRQKLHHSHLCTRTTHTIQVHFEESSRLLRVMITISLVRFDVSHPSVLAIALSPQMMCPKRISIF